MVTKKITSLLLLLLFAVGVHSQTTLALGDIAFTGYNSDPAANSDEFSFVILKSTGITSGTTIYFTDRGWKSGSCGTDNFCTTSDNASFPESGSEFVWTAGSSLSFGTHVKIAGAGSAGTFTCSNGSASGAVLNLSTGGDQIFALQNGAGSTTTTNGPSGTMLAAIHANKATASGCSFSTTNWDDCTSNISVDICQSASNSNRPACLTNGTNALVMLDGSSNEVDNGVYNCTGSYSSTLAAAITASRTAINTTSNWTTNDASTVTIPPSGCNPLSGTYITSTTWNGSTWNNGTPTSTLDAVIASSTTPGNFTCQALTINSGVALTMGSGTTANINGNLTNSGNGFSGTGTFNFAASSTISGNAISCAGTVTVASGATLTTAGLLTLTSDATNTGRIGNSSGSISGNVTVQRYIPGGKRAFRFLAHPFSSSIALTALTDDIDITGTGGATNGFTATGSNSPSAFWYDVTTGDGSSVSDPGWTAFTHTNGSGANSWDQYEAIRVLIRGAIGEGLTGNVYTPSAVTLDATGAVNQGSKVVTITKGTNTDYMFIGNPYPSEINLNLSTRGSNIGSSFYVWNPSSGTRGAYVTTLFSTTYYLPSFSGFFVQASANTNNTITFHEADKSSNGASGTVFKPTASTNSVLFKIYSNNDSITWDQFQLDFDDAAIADSEWYDAPKMYNPDMSLYSFSKDQKILAIDTRPYADSQVIPLGIAYAKQLSYKLKTESFNMPAGTSLFLHDKYLDTTILLSPATEYLFDITSDSLTQGDNRFELATAGKPFNGISTIPESKQKVKLVPNPATNNVSVYYEHFGSGNINVSVTNILGVKVAQVTALSRQNGQIQIPLGHIANGVYTVTVQNDKQVSVHNLIKE